MFSQPSSASRSQAQLRAGVYPIAQRIAFPFLRISLGVIFLWMGIIKFLNPQPVVGVLSASFTFLAFDTFVYILGAIEVIVAVLLFIGLGVRYVGGFMLLFFLGTLIIFLIAPTVTYGSGTFPVLSLAGQFLLKDLGLAAAVLMMVVKDIERQRAKTSE